MILIAESGSTKTDWLIYENGQLIDNCSSPGFNPYFVSSEDVAREILLIPDLKELKDEATHIYFFGAGCSAPYLKEIVKEGVSEVFKKASIQVDHDLAAAAYATYNGTPAISCIIGTGSNSCYFDGQNIREEVPSLAYILGDEGSGSFLGKKVLAAYFYKQLPRDLHLAFEKEFPKLDKDRMTEKVYKSPRPNVFLASFTPFVLKHRDNKMVKDWIEEGFRLFIKNQVLCFPEARKVPIHFVGSIAKILEKSLERCLSEKGLELGNIIARPAKHLGRYVLQNIH
jgi:N-acetylglucosamine kinase-like BadF-type ATPase